MTEEKKHVHDWIRQAGTEKLQGVARIRCKTCPAAATFTVADWERMVADGTAEAELTKL